MSAAIDFAETGEDLVLLVASLARATQGRFDGQAGTALAAARDYITAACFGFSALAGCPELNDAQRLAASVLATGFREAMGKIATYYGGGDTYLSLASLADRSAPERSAMDAFFSDAAPPMVTVSATARAALDSLRRDPLDLVAVGAGGLRRLMAAVAEGVQVRPV